MSEERTPRGSASGQTQRPESRRKFLSEDEARRRLESWCAYQERSHQQVRRKLQQYGQGEPATERTVTHLITSGFLNEERFARAYAGGKFRMKKWGRSRIEAELKRHGLSRRCITSGLKEIDDDGYRKTLIKLLKARLVKHASETPFVRNNKAARFVIGKGYEAELVWDVLRGLVSDAGD